jgi:hypothetical protein
MKKDRKTERQKENHKHQIDSERKHFHEIVEVDLA